MGKRVIVLLMGCMGLMGCYLKPYLLVSIQFPKDGATIPSQTIFMSYEVRYRPRQIVSWNTGEQTLTPPHRIYLDGREVYAGDVRQNLIPLTNLQPGKHTLKLESEYRGMKASHTIEFTTTGEPSPWGFVEQPDQNPYYFFWSPWGQPFYEKQGITVDFIIDVEAVPEGIELTEVPTRIEQGYLELLPGVPLAVRLPILGTGETYGDPVKPLIKSIFILDHIGMMEQGYVARLKGSLWRSPDGTELNAPLGIFNGENSAADERGAYLFYRPWDAYPYPGFFLYEWNKKGWDFYLLPEFARATARWKMVGPGVFKARSDLLIWNAPPDEWTRVHLTEDLLPDRLHQLYSGYVGRLFDEYHDTNARLCGGTLWISMRFNVVHPPEPVNVPVLIQFNQGRLIPIHPPEEHGYFHLFCIQDTLWVVNEYSGAPALVRGQIDGEYDRKNHGYDLLKQGSGGTYRWKGSGWETAPMPPMRIASYYETVAHPSGHLSRLHEGTANRRWYLTLSMNP